MKFLKAQFVNEMKYLEKILLKACRSSNGKQSWKTCQNIAY